MKSIRTKLLAVVMGTTAVAVLAMYSFVQWSFDRGFSDYLRQQELARLDPLKTALVEHYLEAGSWSQLQENGRLWRQMHRETLDTDGALARAPHNNHPDGPRGSRRPPPPPQQSDSLAQRLILADADGRRIIGRPDVLDPEKPLLSSVNRAELRTAEGVIIGYLFIADSRTQKSILEQGFLDSQTSTLVLIAALVLLLAAMIAIPVAVHFSRPLRALVAGTRQLAGGDHGTRIHVHSEDELGQLTRDFNSLAQSLEAAEQTRQRWISDISHELRTPIAVLKAQIEAIIDGVRQPGPDVLKSLESNVNQLGMLVEDLYQLSLSDMNALTYHKEWMTLEAVLQDALEAHEQQLQDAGVHAAITTGSQPGRLYGDAQRLLQLLDNLIVNTIRYTDAPGTVEFAIQEVDDGVILTCADSAPGVPDSQLPMLFERLHRVDRSRSRASGGAGLGLSLCRTIAEAHHGTISASASPLGGLCIRVELKSGGGEDS